MSREHPGEGCWDLAFQGAYPLDDGGEAPLEDYARALTRADDAEVLRAEDDPAMIVGVHVCSMSATLGPALLTDVEDFARSLVLGQPGGGLGWS